MFVVLGVVVGVYDVGVGACGCIDRVIASHYVVVVGCVGGVAVGERAVVCCCF